MSVIVVGAGPTGLMLAGDLAAAGVPVTVLEKRALESNLTRAFGVHARTLEILDMRGCADELVPQGRPVGMFRPQMGRGDLSLSFRHPESRFPFVLIVPQARTEALLLRRAEELGAKIETGAEVTGLEQDAGGVALEVNGAPGPAADYVVGCDGAHSRVRALLGVGFTGRNYDTKLLLADIRTTSRMQEGINGLMGRDGAILFPAFGDGWYRAVIWDRAQQGVPLEAPLGVAEVLESIRRISGRDIDIEEMRWSTRFLTERRQADRYRVGRVFLAGDAAHVNSPMGSLGMNTGIQDAANLAWKLIAAHRGRAPDWLLDSYQTERHPVGRTALKISDLLLRSAVAPRAVHVVRPYAARLVLAIPLITRFLRRTIAGMNISYPAPPGLPRSSATGLRVDDRELSVEGRRVRLYELVEPDRFLLLDHSEDGAAAAAVAGWGDRVTAVAAPGQRPSRASTVMLLRPDGYLAWSHRAPSPGRVREAVAHWCGSPRPSPQGSSLSSSE
ncbi:FAD-dependent monooxygenase [Actinomadura rugatobispora]|uniref:FAD-dependent monooxygenase n=1 Tax=Actinomadura rugatobispora TaxID=1994 RepID=A0ABW0ZP71_9ACTN